MNKNDPSAIYRQLETLAQPRAQSAERNVSETSEHFVEDENGNTITATKFKRTRRKTEPDC